MTLTHAPRRQPRSRGEHRVGTSAFTEDDFARRLERVALEAAQGGFNGVMATPGPDLLYLCGYTPAAVTERFAALLVAAGHPPTLVVPHREGPDAAAAPGAGLLSITSWDDGDDPYARLSGIIDPEGIYAVSDSTWAIHLLSLERVAPATLFRPLSDAFPMQRAIKEETEVGRLVAAAAAADVVYTEILGVRFAGRTERQLAADLADLLRDFGHSRVDFTVVASGPNGANPHYEAGDRVIQFGDAVVLDFGGILGGYGSDLTRTVSVGPPGSDLRAVHAVVRRAQQAAFEAVRPGVSCQSIDHVAREVITDAGYGDFFVHRTGHGIGLTTHEPPYLVAGETQVLRAGMCFSIEPGIYLPDRFGVRVEDIVTVTATGGRRLNRTSHDLATVY